MFSYHGTVSYFYTQTTPVLSNNNLMSLSNKMKVTLPNLCFWETFIGLWSSEEFIKVYDKFSDETYCQYTHSYTVVIKIFINDPFYS